MRPPKERTEAARAALVEKVVRSFARQTPEEVERRLLRMYAMLREAAGEDVARRVFDGLSDAYDVHRREQRD